jgi:hypothetical protein
LGCFQAQNGQYKRKIGKRGLKIFENVKFQVGVGKNQTKWACKVSQLILRHKVQSGVSTNKVVDHKY